MTDKFILRGHLLFVYPIASERRLLSSVSRLANARPLPLQPDYPDKGKFTGVESHFSPFIDHIGSLQGDVILSGSLG